LGDSEGKPGKKSQTGEHGWERGRNSKSSSKAPSQEWLAGKKPKPQPTAGGPYVRGRKRTNVQNATMGTSVFLLFVGG